MKSGPLLIVLVLLAGVFSAIPAFGQTGTAITVKTDKQTYSDGDQMAISGTVASQLNVPISIVIKDPAGNVVLIGQITPNQDNTYSTTITTGGDLWAAVGAYEVDVTYGSKDNTAKATFQFTGSTLTAPITIDGQEYNATYKITNGKVLAIVPDTSAKSLTIRIQPSGNGTLSINLPRSLIDAKSGGQDTSYVVEEDGRASPFNETNTDASSRTITLQFGPGASQVTIIGTQIVPEFSTLAAAVLAIAMAAVLIRLRPGYHAA